MTVPIVHRDELLGAISIRIPKAEVLRPAGRQLVQDVASQAGLVLANAALIEDLRASRQRLVSAQDETRRHAKASSARICLHAEDGIVRFSVSDNGTGYDARRARLGSGQRNMADRVAALGGRLDVRSAPGQGTTITGYLPG